MAGRPRIVVSIDFGTTYSGVAWADTSKPGVQHVISEWPTANGIKKSPKVPTELRKIANGYQWGFQIPDSAKRIRFFKLKLDEPNKSNADGESPLHLTKIYLSFLKEYFMQVLDKKLTPEVARSRPMDFVVTVPAIWSPIAKQATERAAAMAGFCGNQRIVLTSEPEAAALYALKSANLSGLKTGQRYTICDAGGGTVDLITYEVQNTSNLCLKEVTEGTGGRCGSAMLNMRFRRYLKQVHGEKYWPDDHIVPALHDFEKFKQTFSPDGRALTLRTDPRLGLRNNRYIVSQSDMKAKIFEPVMKDVVCLVQEQISMAGGKINGVILVGGFGQSKYLKSRLQSSIGKKIQILHPEHSWAAVVKGALLHGLARCVTVQAPKIVSRVARRSYGTCLSTKYDPQKHNPRQAFWDGKEEEMMVFVMLWFIKKGESYPENKPASIDYQCDIPVNMGRPAQSEIEVFVNDDKKPPIHLDNKTRPQAVLSLDLRNVADSVKRQASIQRMGGFRYYSIPGAIEATYGPAMVTYRAKLAGVTHDMIRVEYEAS